ncbi:MAG TPA: alpha/beta fold hydrolase [Candidatus Krumholzibacteria bacterium]|nr:alpha/beta fold hydrolase [Candidatus Krumholzibacteria bacterium]
MPFRFSPVICTVCIGLLAAVAVPAHAQEPVATPDSSAADSVAVVVRKPTVPITPFFIEGIEDTFLTATLEVPENRDLPDGRKIALHIVVVPAIERVKGAPPLFDIAGGPGMAATMGAAEYATALRIHRQRRDVVLVDQRGTGQSGPLRCAELEAPGGLGDIYDVAAVARCRDALAGGADLAHYTTLDAVRDLEDVRNALAYDQIDLSGISYGTLVVQTYMREYPENVHAAVMLGAVPLGEKIPLHHARNAEEILQRVLDDCDGDPDCGRAFPSLRREWGELLDALIDGPVLAQYTDSTGTRTVPVYRGPFCEKLRELLYSTSMQRRVPFLIHQAAVGNFQPFLDIAFVGGSSPFAEGMYLCVTCPEGTGRIAPDEIDAATARTFLGRYRVDRQIAACEAWGLAPRPETDFTPVTSTVPTLFINGSMDGVTPVAWAQEISARLTNSLVLVVDYLGHAPEGLTNMECYDRVIDEFFRAGSVAGLDTACLESMAPPEYTTE